MITGEFPRHISSQNWFNDILNNPIIPIRKRDASIPSKLAEVIDRALIEQPELQLKIAKDFKKTPTFLKSRVSDRSDSFKPQLP